MHFHPALLNPTLRRYDEKAIRRWSRRIGSRARDALHLADRYRCALGSREGRLDRLEKFFNLDLPNHAFHVEPHRWLKLTEVQVTRAFAYFLTVGGAARILAFLRALDPLMHWPADLALVTAEAEVPTGQGRIDLLIKGKAPGGTWGAVVEAKFAHDLKSNPLSDYARGAVTAGMLIPAAIGGERTGILAVVGPGQSRHTRSRLTRNTRWCFVHWQALLRRFELEMAGQTDDLTFRQFRRTVWEKIL